MSFDSNDCGYRGQGLHHIFETKDVVYASLRLNSGLRTGFVGEPPIHLCLYIATIIQSMLESDDMRFQAILLQNHILITRTFAEWGFQ